MTAVVIRPAEPADVGQLTETAVRSWTQAYEGVLTENAVAEAPKRLRQAIADDWRDIFVAEARRDGIVGYFDFEPGTSHIRRIYVDPKHHRRGIGRLMIEAALDILRDRGFSAATIDVVEGTKAPAFHRALGWREVARAESRDGVFVISMIKDL
ncbi:MAG: GNAT family N-acetyltransferase [Alphaproteobacteria bacterium]